MKRLFALSMVCVCLALPFAARGVADEPSAVASIGTVPYATLQAAFDAADGGTVKLMQDVVLTATQTLSKGVTLAGNGFTITAAGLSPAFDVSTASAVVFDDVTLTGAKRGLGVSNLAAQVTLTSCRFSVEERGITLSLPDQSLIYDGVSIVLDGTTMNQSGVTEENKGTYTAYNGSRGISLWNTRNATVTLRNGSEFNGFSYGINVAGTKDANGVIDTTGLVVTVEDSTLRGWTGFNVWGASATYVVTRSTILGINTSSGASDDFSAITFNDDIYDQFTQTHAVNNTLQFTDATITNYQGGACVQNLLRIDCGITQLKLSGAVRFIDTTGNIRSALYLKHMKDPMTFLANDVVLAEGATVTCTTLDGQTLPFAPTITAYYYWNNGSGGFEGVSCDLKEIFTEGSDLVLCNGEFIKLLADATLDGDVTAVLDEKVGNFTFTLDGHAVTGGKVILPVDVSVTTDTEDAAGLFMAAAGASLSVTVHEDGTYTYLAVPVARIGAVGYATLQAAFDAVQDGETVTLLTDVTVDGGGNAVYYRGGKSFTVDFAGHALTANTTNAAIVVVDGGSQTSTTLTLTGGAITAGVNAYCAVLTGVKTGGDVTVNLTGMTLNNSRQNGACLKALAGTSMRVTGTTITSTNGAGGVEAAGGAVTLTDCTVNQSGTHDWVSMDVSASNGGTVTVNRGSYTSAAYGAYIFNSGGTIIINGGTFEAGTAVLKADLSTTSAPSLITVTGGAFAGAYAITSGAFLSISGGMFSQAVPAQYCAEGFVPMVSSEGVYTVKAAPAIFSVDADGTVTEHESLDAIPDGTTGVTLAPSAVAEGDTHVVTDTTASNCKNGTEAQQVAEVLNGTFAATKAEDGQTTVLTYDYDFGVSGLEVKADGADGALNAYIVVGLKENGRVLDDDRLLTGRTLTVTVALWDNDPIAPRTYTVSDPLFKADTVRKASVCRVQVPWTDLTLGTNAITVTVSKDAPVTP